MWIIKPVLWRTYSPISNEAGRITSRVVLEDLTDGQWPASNDRRYLGVMGTHNQLVPYADNFSRDRLQPTFETKPQNMRTKKIMKARNIIDIIERFQTHHALQEEREMKNFHASTNGALVPDVSNKNGMPENSIAEMEELLIAEQPSRSQLTK
jgi:hypothetical protein